MSQTSMTMQDAKREFARISLRDPDVPAHIVAQRVARLAGVSDPASIGYIATWTTDPETLEFVKELKAGPPEDILPDRWEVARMYMSIASHSGYEASDRLKALDKYTELMDFKKQPVAQAQQVVNVMLVADKGSDDMWAASLEVQQSKMIEHENNEAAD